MPHNRINNGYSPVCFTNYFVTTLYFLVPSQHVYMFISVDDESKKDDDKSESQTAEEESVSRL